MYNNEPTITIPLDEYKELLMIKGKYEELKFNQTITPIYPTFPSSPTQPKITWDFYSTTDKTDN